MNSEDFKSDVRRGLSSQFKSLPSKYFYDDQGSLLFEKIMQMPEYYLSAAETEILKHQSEDIHSALNPAPKKIVEFGSGDGSKTIHLLRVFQAKKNPPTYVPVDISNKAIERLSKNLQLQLPDQKVSPITGNYFSYKPINLQESSLFLFLGSNIGNYNSDETVDLLKSFHENMLSGDHLLIGFDLIKNAQQIIEAYDDPHGITRAFNLNLLARINRELQADFDLDKFEFLVDYNATNGELKSYLKSLVRQTVYIGSLLQYFSFERDELIWTELSKKYHPSEIENLASMAHFNFVRHYYDSQKRFALSLWSK